MKNLISGFLLLFVFVSSMSNAQTPTEPTIKCELQEVLSSDTSRPQISVLASDSKPLKNFWLSANVSQKGSFLITGGIQQGVASAILSFKDFSGNHSLVQSLSFSPGSQLQIELGSAKVTNGFGGLSIRLSCDISRD